jgi:hypothetical protein
MRSAVGKAISATPASRLPNLLFGGATAADPDPALTASGDLPTFYCYSSRRRRDIRSRSTGPRRGSNEGA